MGRKLNLSHLSEAECEHILNVVHKDFNIRYMEKERLRSVSQSVYVAHPLPLLRTYRSLSLYLCLCLSISVSFSISLSLLCLPIYVSLSLSLSVSPSHSLSFS